MSLEISLDLQGRLQVALPGPDGTTSHHVPVPPGDAGLARLVDLLRRQGASAERESRLLGAHAAPTVAQLGHLENHSTFVEGCAFCIVDRQNSALARTPALRNVIQRVGDVIIRKVPQKGRQRLVGMDVTLEDLDL